MKHFEEIHMSKECMSLYMCVYIFKKKSLGKAIMFLWFFESVPLLWVCERYFSQSIKYSQSNPQPLWVSPAQEQREESCSSKSVETQGINYGDRSGVAFWGPREGHNHFQMTLNTQLAVRLSKGHLNVSLRSSSKSFRHTDIRKTLGRPITNDYTYSKWSIAPSEHQLQA